MMLLILAAVLMAVPNATAAQDPAAANEGLAVAERTPRLIRALSGPSGTVVGSEFVFDETRNRFVYPQDSAVAVFFEWETEPGDQVLSAVWRQPDGRVAVVSPDVKLRTETPQLKSYWTFMLASHLTAGAWTLEVRINGQPAGSHVFELAGVAGPAVRLSLDDVFKRYLPSVVRVHRKVAAADHVDSTTGFVIRANAVATAFQSIDSADTIEVEFADGRRVAAEQVLSASRLGDWAVLAVDTATIVPIPVAESDSIEIGGRVAVFEWEHDGRIIVPIDVGATSRTSPYGGRIQFTSPVSAAAAGGPVIDEGGQVIGIVGGSQTPGFRGDLRMTSARPWLLPTSAATSFATPASEVVVPAGGPARPLDALRSDRLLTAPMAPMAELLLAGATKTLPKDPGDRFITDAREFSSSSDTPITVYAYWVKTGSRERGDLSVAIHDVQNRLVIATEPIRMRLRDRDQRSSFTVSPKGMPPGYYRVDLLWDGTSAWRTYVRVVD